MAKYPWAKIWIDIIDDKKMKKLSDHQFRLFIYFMLAAREYDQDGMLPDLDDLAWRIRYPKEDIEQVLDALSDPALNITTCTNENWMLTHFLKRQSRYDPTRAVRQERYRISHKYEPTENSNGNSNGKSNGKSDGGDSVSVSVSDSVSLIKDSSKSKLFSLRDAERAYMQVTGFASTPAGLLPQLEIILDLIQHYGWNEAINRLNTAKNNWIAQKNKTNGQPYRLTNPAWIDLAISGEIVGSPPILTKFEQDRIAIDKLIKGNQK